MRVLRSLAWRLVFGAGLCALVGSAEVARAESLAVDATYTRTLKGGVAVDGWGETSTETTFATGALQIQLPAGAVVEEAVLVSATVNRFSGPSYPAGPTGFPRVVILGSGANTQTRTLEGTPDAVVAGSSAFGSWFTNVSTTVKTAIGATASGAVVAIPISERGDGTTDEQKIAGHTLIVVYSHPSAPLRNVLVALGAAGTTFFNGTSSSTLALPSAALACGERMALSLSDVWEFNVWTERSRITVNGTDVSTTAGGADDFASVPAGTGAGLATGGLITVGSFGGGGAGMIGAPLGLKGDSVTGLPTPPRLDDELYDVSAALGDGATQMTVQLANTTDAEFLSAVVLQTLARVQPNDADGDGLADGAEAACPVDTDSDGTPNLLDPDSDNDCLGDATDPAPTLPSGPSTTNCPNASAPICTGTGVQPSCGPCTTTAQCTQRSAALPICQSGACVAAPVIVTPTDGQTFVSAVSGTGTGPASSTLVLFAKLVGAPDFTVAGSINVDAGGNWAVGPIALPPGSYTIFVRSSVGGSDTDSNEVTFNIVAPIVEDLLTPPDLGSVADLTAPPVEDLLTLADDLTAPTPDLTAPPVEDLLTIADDLTAPPSPDLTTPPTLDLTTSEGADLTPVVTADLTPVVTADLTPPEGADLTPPEGADLTPPVVADMTTTPADLTGMPVPDLRVVRDFASPDLIEPAPDMTDRFSTYFIAGGGFGCSTSGGPDASALGLLLFAAGLSARRLARRRR